MKNTPQVMSLKRFQSTLCCDDDRINAQSLENYDLIVDRYTSPNATCFQYREGNKEYEIPGMILSLPL